MVDRVPLARVFPLRTAVNDRGCRMAIKDDKKTDQNDGQPEGLVIPKPTNNLASQALYVVGVLLVFATFGIIVFVLIEGKMFSVQAFFSTVTGEALLRGDAIDGEFVLLDHWVSNLAIPTIFLALTGVSMIGAYLILRVAGSLNKQIIPHQDYEILSQALLHDKDRTIDNYIKLSSLTGLMGRFTQLGLSGLPLATILITVLFALLAIWVFDPTLSAGFFDLAKLTLGAFLGSYVQRQVQPQQSSSGIPSVPGMNSQEEERRPSAP